MRLGLAVLRAIVGGLFFAHGTQKLFGWFGGSGPDAMGDYFESLGLAPGKRNAIAAGASEAGGGALLALGLLTPLSTAMISGTMATAIRTQHLPKGLWNTEGGYEYNLVLMGLLFAIADLGPGGWSMDHRLGTELSGPAVALAQLAGGLGGSEAIISAGRSAAAGS